VTIDEPAQADDPGRQRWTWDQQILPRWLLVGHTGTPQFADEDAVALCADVDGLFVDLPPRPREWFTLRGCVPDGVLASILDSLTLDTADTDDTGRAWLGNLWVSARPDDSSTQRGWFGVRLLDVTVLDHQPSAISPGCVDVKLRAWSTAPMTCTTPATSPDSCCAVQTMRGGVSAPMSPASFRILLSGWCRRLPWLAAGPSRHCWPRSPLCRSRRRPACAAAACPRR
jgi:hypothetical protein